MSVNSECTKLNIDDLLETREEPDLSVRIHKLGFYNAAPRAINCLAHSRTCDKLAVARDDETIEIWDVKFSPCLERVMPTFETNLKAITWCNDRLLSGAENSSLAEWSLSEFQKLRSVNMVGNGISCIDVNKQCTYAVVGTENGFLNVVDVSNNQLEMCHILERQDRSIFCCKFDHTGENVVISSFNNIRVINFKNRHATTQISLKCGMAKSETLVRSLQVLNDFTIVAGDSHGQLTFWDGKTGYHIQTQQASKLSILHVSVCEDGNTVLCTGIEPVIRFYERAETAANGLRFKCWVKSFQRAPHNHDIQTLACVGKYVYSGGMDGYLGVSLLMKREENVRKYGQFLLNPCLYGSASENLVLFRYMNYLELWHLGATYDVQNTNSICNYGMDNIRSVGIRKPPKKLLQLKSKESAYILSAALSADGTYICYSTLDGLRIFLIELEENQQPQLTSEKATLLNDEVASHMHFHKHYHRLYLVNPITKKIQVYDGLYALNNEIELSHSINIEKWSNGGIKLFTVSENGLCVAIVNGESIASVWSKKKQQSFIYLNSVPKRATISAIALYNNLTESNWQIVLAYTDNKLAEYNFEEMRYTSLIDFDFINERKTNCITSILLNMDAPTILYLQNDDKLFVIQRRALSEKPKPKKKKKQRNIISASKYFDFFYELLYTENFRHFVSMAWCNNHELAALSVEPISIFSKLPPGFKKKKFATK